jgi:hypothetical protein
MQQLHKPISQSFSLHDEAENDLFPRDCFIWFCGMSLHFGETLKNLAEITGSGFNLTGRGSFVIKLLI